MPEGPERERPYLVLFGEAIAVCVSRIFSRAGDAVTQIRLLRTVPPEGIRPVERIDPPPWLEPGAPLHRQADG